MLRYLTSGESHGKLINAILEGIPSGLELSEEDVNIDLRRRQSGYGRGERMKIERDEVEITSGVRFGKTMGSPISMIIRNRDWENWKNEMSIIRRNKGINMVTRPRPGHADLAGGIKYNEIDLRNIFERSSARETACRVAVGAVARKILAELGIKILSHVISIGNIRAKNIPRNPNSIVHLAERSDLRCADAEAERKMKDVIDKAKNKGDSVGGIFEIIVMNPPVGLGSHTQWDRKLDGKLARALMSIQAIKGIETGMGFRTADLFGSQVHDEIYYRKDKRGFYRKTNNAGGIEGGISNGEDIVLRAAMKPIPTLLTPLRSVDIITKKPFKASVERSDVCAVPSAAVVGEAVVAFEMADAVLEKFGGDSLKEMKRNFNNYREYINRL
ncbi:MAG: chorismate synthase [Candidatus Schekmanbacteria bacterium RIFCSPHIGHO2_02_FULL_38_11]|uniref:Chorismate synthase n=1 Tax=Candidatus Schekmanbacteria bacterium RIFCSPLOWO2_12_FULL_38_15 TaxID=1817883 RepID=A0A1F7SK85_9BACT|nr:MAG: chorismate synthase [Candidatus Schekmanbacteria bacterium GWA2_38_9]OGL49986.1 MAG: chorismate synthase [Candidatus Schekmanbacteria bacterium RIFCSPHIGHO2_02_FULL_38_11]OGL51230.1 MAG: chorismate synthase [Candidatus Schekmanbacteria bacterium RIFCSPLOWO2_02_FULL_38_14]OGL54181.1 MAG: chorismate synthase [Candidatus Schekmanbacteria bacterium RIFCSPLOWO2_12_FULL_38_15]